MVIMTRRNDGELQQVLDMAAELGVPRAGTGAAVVLGTHLVGNVGRCLRVVQSRKTL
ncbi:hypothetical protein [Streptomyces sp. PTD5-9]|uniref:hypothetical protein n=1 Tax=Streptomyces sp. PTD5-9 TaxID=3120150 RepID=UPI003008C44F